MYSDPTDVYKTQIHNYTVFCDRRYIDCFDWMRLCFNICWQRCLYIQSRRYKQMGAYNRSAVTVWCWWWCYSSMGCSF